MLWCAHPFLNIRFRNADNKETSQSSGSLLHCCSIQAEVLRLFWTPQALTPLYFLSGSQEQHLLNDSSSEILLKDKSRIVPHIVESGALAPQPIVRDFFKKLVETYCSIHLPIQAKFDALRWYSPYIWKQFFLSCSRRFLWQLGELVSSYKSYLVATIALVTSKG